MKQSTDKAQATPTKQFFVSMLTRDVGLHYSIVGLLDNCLDSAMRRADRDRVDYSRHFVRIRVARYHCSIEDSCGGIRRAGATSYAPQNGARTRR